MSGALLLDFAVIWDEDHDTRVIEVIEQIYLQGLMAPVRFVGERKGNFIVFVSDDFSTALGREKYEDYLQDINDICSALRDPWTTSVHAISSAAHSIIHAPMENVELYLDTIQLLWRVGTRFPPDGFSCEDDSDEDF